MSTKTEKFNDFLTTFGWIFLMTIGIVSGLGYMNIYSLDGILQTTCQMDSKLGCTENILLKDTLENDTILIEIINHYEKNITINKIIFYEKELYEFINTENCSFNSKQKILSNNYGLVSGKTNYFDFEKCGMYSSIGKRQTFNIKIYYSFEESNIEMISMGELITHPK